MAETKTDKQQIRRKKFIDVDVPITHSKLELIGNTPRELQGKTIKLDMTRQLKGKSVELVLKIRIENEKAVAYPDKIKLMPYFIRRMIRKRISYVEDSFRAPSQESLILLKPFLITKRRVSRQIRKTLRNKAKNWIEDYISEKKDSEIFSEILSNRMQKSLSVSLKKTYPLSLCEIRIMEILRVLTPEEIPEIKPKIQDKKIENVEEEFIDQMKEIEDERIKKAEKEIKETQQKATKDNQESQNPESEAQKPAKEKKSRKKSEEKKE